MSAGDLELLAAGILSGSRRDLGRAITAIEEDESAADLLLAGLPELPGSFRIGLTGAPGVGKSSLISKLVPKLIEKGQRVAVLAIDPTSPLSGGALLGDRARMPGELGEDAWFRSIASRGATNGVAGCTDLAAEVLGRAGFNIVIIETVGVGQLEVEIGAEADQAWLLLSPESGDAIQLLKAGVLEVVDRVVIHKCDRPGAEELMRWAEEAARDQQAPEPLSVSSQDGTGIDQIADTLLEAARAHREAPDPQRVQARILRRIRRRMEQEWVRRGLEAVGGQKSLEQLAVAVSKGEITVKDALGKLISPDTKDTGS
ncbi:MAG: methylmalonyl Co-A mutase-associated GTPase MeaB [Planctomycetota bacterium]